MTDYAGRDLSPAITKVIDEQLASANWHVEVLPSGLTGLSRDVEVIRGRRTRSTMLTFDWHGDEGTFCPPMWWDLAIGVGACHFSCRTCFLLLTHRAYSDPLRHRLYDNVDDYHDLVKMWLAATEWKHPRDKSKMVKLSPRTTLGLGIDRSDSLLYEGITGHARRLIPLFADPATNPQGRRLILLTKSANVFWLNYTEPEVIEGFPAYGKLSSLVSGDVIPNVSVTFSLNPELIADLWEGKWPDTGQRITPPVKFRLLAARGAAMLGFDTRWRLDPILPVDGWQEIYADWFKMAVNSFDANPSYITLGTYREKNNQLDTWREKWGLLPPEYEPGDLQHDGTHWHLPEEKRAEIYAEIRRMIIETWTAAGRPAPKVSLCKESHTIRKALNLCNADCNCLQ